MTEPTGLCARCQKPGYCCKVIRLNIAEPEGFTSLEALAWLATNPQPYIDGTYEPLPLLPTEEFLPAWRGMRRVWYCSELDENGRCKIYDRRPKMCAEPVPGSDDYCWHHDETVDPIWMKLRD